MKNVFTNKELPHIWAHRSQPSGRSSTMFFRDDTIYSYGEHFPVAKFVEDRHGNTCILFATRTNSVTTAKHMSMIRRAISSEHTVYYVTHPADSVREEALDKYRDRFNAEVNRIRASREGWGVDQLPDRLAEMQEFKHAFKLKGGVPGMPDFTAWTAKWERSRALSSIRHAALEARRFEARRKYETKRVEKFLGISPLPFELKPGMAFMRVVENLEKPEDTYIETSMGVQVPLEHVKRVAPIVLALIREGRTYKKNGHTIHLGNYTLDEVTAEGEVIAGCHRFSKEEIIRFAKVIKVEA